MLIVEECNFSRQREREDLLSHAYHTARFQRLKRLPSLKKILEEAKPKEPKRPQTDQQMLAFALIFQAKFEKGGNQRGSRP